MRDKNILHWPTSFFFTLPFHRPNQNEEGNWSHRYLCILHSLLLCAYTNKFLSLCALICERLCMKLLGLFHCCFIESTLHTLCNSKMHWKVTLNVIKTCDTAVNIITGWHSWWKCKAMIQSLKMQLIMLFVCSQHMHGAQITPCK